MKTERKSPRQELRSFVGCGRLRQVLENAYMSREAVQLAIDVVMRYCEPRSRSRSTKH